MKILESYNTFIIDENNRKLKLTICLVKCNDLYGYFSCLMPLRQQRQALNFTDNADRAYEVYDLLCKNAVLPYNLLSVLDDLDFELAYKKA